MTSGRLSRGSGTPPTPLVEVPEDIVERIRILGLAIFSPLPGSCARPSS